MIRVCAVSLLVALVAVACSDSSSETTTTMPQPTTTSPATPTTTVPDVTVTPIVPGDDEDADAIAELYLIVFDSTTTFVEKSLLIDDPAGLDETVTAYAGAGDAVGGILLEATAVGIDGDEAVVLYDLLFAGAPFQPDQEGSAVRSDGTWKVTREFFCSIMSLARVSCP